MEVNGKLLKQITETSYLTAENTSRYRPILRFFYEEYETTNYMLYKEEVFSNLKDKIGFDKKTYLRNISEVEISELRLSKLKNIKSKELAEICEELKIHKRASYEEKNIDNLCGFTYKL